MLTHMGTSVRALHYGPVKSPLSIVAVAAVLLCLTLLPILAMLPLLVTLWLTRAHEGSMKPRGAPVIDHGPPVSFVLPRRAPVIDHGLLRTAASC